MKKIVSLLFLLASCLISSAQQKAVLEDAPLNVIVIVNHSMSYSYIAAGIIKNKDSLYLEKMPASCSMKSWIKGSGPDRFVFGSALATGKVVQPGNLSEDAWGKPLKTLFEDARERRMATGIITTSSITRSPMLAFLFHLPSLKKDEEMATLIANNPPDMVFAGGSSFFVSKTDKKGLLEGLKAKHYILEDNYKKITSLISSKIFALTAEDDIPYEQLSKGFLYNASSCAVQNQITNREGGFFYVVESSTSTKILNYKRLDYLADEAIEFSKIVQNIVQKAGPQTLVVVVGDEDAGSVELTNCNTKKNTVDGAWDASKRSNDLLPVFASGPMSSKFTGILDRTDVFKLITQALQAR